MTRLPSSLLIAGVAGLAVSAAPVAAQQRATVSVTARQAAERGWVGISVQQSVTQDDRGLHRTVITITDVNADSPAARAGLRVGDVLVAVNGRQGLPSAVLAGDTVRVTVLQEGQTRELTLVAAPRPADVDTTPVVTLTFGADSMVDRAYQAMDSLRVRLVRGQNGVTVVNVGGLPDAIVDRSAAPFPIKEVRPPFGYLIFRGEANDSLTEAMGELNQRIRDLQSQRTTRVGELAKAARGDVTRIDTSDRELRRIELQMVDANEHAALLREAMDRATRRDAAQDGQRVYVRRLPDGTEPPDPGFRPLDPYLLGQNRAAGAEVVELRPELADYFGVEGGVLVVDVPERTPAALAGLQPGDVLTAVGRRPIRSIQELRAGLADAEPEIPLTLIRKGAELHVVLKR